MILLGTVIAVILLVLALLHIPLRIRTAEGVLDFVGKGYDIFRSIPFFEFTFHSPCKNCHRTGRDRYEYSLTGTCHEQVHEWGVLRFGWGLLQADQAVKLTILKTLFGRTRVVIVSRSAFAHECGLDCPSYFGRSQDCMNEFLIPPSRPRSRH